MAAVFAIVAAGCAPSVRGAAKDASQGATTGVVSTLEQPGAQRAAAEIMGSPEMQKAVREFARSIAAGVVDTVTSDQETAQAKRFTQAMARTAASAIFAELSSRENLQRMQEVATAAADGAVDTAMKRIARELPNAVGAMIHHEIGPGMQSLVNDPQVQAAMDAAAYRLSRDAVLGSNEATVELAHQKSHKAGLLAHLSTMFAEGGIVVALILLALAAAVVALLIAFLREHGRVRRFATERAAVEQVERREGGSGFGRPAPLS